MLIHNNKAGLKLKKKVINNNILYYLCALTKSFLLENNERPLY